MSLDPVVAQEAIAAASLPTLVMCLAQVTGDRYWLTDRFRATRDTNLFADESGGLPDDVQAEVRSATMKLLVELDLGQREVPTDFNFDDFPSMMTVCLGEEVPPEYTRMLGEEMQLLDRNVHWQTSVAPLAAGDFRVLIIGAGFSGLCAAIKLDGLGIAWELLEKNADLGGTWFENSYPDAGVDTPNHFYSYSFAPNTRWTGYFSKRDEIWGYARDVASRYHLTERIEFSTEVRSLDWEEDNQRWRISSNDRSGAERIRYAHVVISAVGQLNRPKIPAIPGLDTFPGDVFHTASWRHDVPLTNRSVAVVGTGASAMQLLPKVAADAAHLTVFQRSPQWVRPAPDYHRTVDPEMIWLLENVPFYANWYRFGLLWRFGDGLLSSLRRDPDWPHPERAMNRRNDRHRVQMAEYIEHELEGRPDLVEKAMPHYPPYGKRILVDNHWFKTITRDNVQLTTSAVARVEGNCVIAADGTSHPADVIILATGFEAGKLLAPMHVVGANGQTLADVWGEDDPRAYLGITMPDFPNLFCMLGPGTGIAHGGSAIYQSECQIRYITDCLVQMLEAGIASIDVSRTVHDEYIDRFDAEHRELVWSHPGMRNWYRNDAGRVFGPMPWRLVDYWAMTHEADLSCYRTTSSVGR